jgi:hypothetical protein
MKVICLFGLVCLSSCGALSVAHNSKVTYRVEKIREVIKTKEGIQKKHNKKDHIKEHSVGTDNGVSIKLEK